jgi:hypothetical protein
LSARSHRVSFYFEILKFFAAILGKKIAPKNEPDILHQNRKYKLALSGPWLL